MTDQMMSFRALVEKAPDADILRDMIGFAAERLIGDGSGRQNRVAERGERSLDTASSSATAIATGTGRRGPETALSFASPSCARAPCTSRASWSRGAWRRRR